MAKSKKSINEKYNSPFATAIRKLMDDRGTTQDKLAEEIDKTRQTVSQYVNGISEPGYNTLVKIADFFDVSTDFLLGRTQDKSRSPSAIDQLGISESVVAWLKSIGKESEDDHTFSDGINHVLENNDFRSLVYGLRQYKESLKARKIYRHLSHKLCETHERTNYREFLWTEIEKLIKSNAYSDTVCKCLAGEFYVSEVGVFDKLNKITATILRDGLVSDFSEIYASQILRDFTLFLSSLEEEIKYTSIQDIMPNYAEVYDHIDVSE